MAEWPAETSDLPSFYAKLKEIMEKPVQTIFDAQGETTHGGNRVHERWSSGFRNPLYRLSTMGLVPFKGGEVRATELKYPPSLA